MDCRKKRGRTFSEKRVCWQCLTCHLCSRASCNPDALRHLAMPSGYLIPAPFLFRSSNFRTAPKISLRPVLPPSAIHTFLFSYWKTSLPQVNIIHPACPVIIHTLYIFSLVFFFSFFSFFSHTQQHLFFVPGVQHNSFFSLPEDGTEIGRKHRQMLEAVCLTLQQQTRFNISRCFRATSTLFLHFSVLHHSLSFFFLFSFFDFFSSPFYILPAWSSRSETSRDVGDRLGLFVFSKNVYRCTGLGAYVFFVFILFLLPVCVAISANVHPCIYTFRRPPAIGIASGLFVHMFIYISCFTFYIFVYTFICNFI